MKKITIPLTICSLLLITTPNVSANVGLSVNPPVTEVLLAPNKSVSIPITLTNLGDETRYTLSLHEAIPLDNQGHTTINPAPLNLSSIPLTVSVVGGDWDTIYSLPAGTSRSHSLTLAGASLDEAKDVYLAFVARPLSPDYVISSTTTPAVTALILTTLTPTPALPTNLTLSPLKLPPLVDSALPLAVSPAVNNSAPIMLRVKGLLKLSSPSGKLLQEYPLPPTLILGNTSRNLPTTTFYPKPTHIGPHTLVIELQTEGGRTLLTSSHVVWILPLRALVLTIVALIILTVLKIRYNRLTKPREKA